MANGHDSGSLHDCQLLLDFFMRQPVSARITTRCGLALGSGSTREPTDATFAVAGTVASQAFTGKDEAFESLAALAVVRCAMVPAATRRLMRVEVPSTVSSGQTVLSTGEALFVYVVTARTTAWLLSPISTHAAWILLSAVAASAGVAATGVVSEDEPPQPAITAAAVSAASVTIVSTVRLAPTGANIHCAFPDSCCEEGARYPRQMALF